MRVLIADRNARLLESISRTFSRQFSIQTASTRKHCGDLLRQGEFDLVIVSEKLTDGPGLQLLGQIARSSPDTLRIFAARRSRLELLKGKLGPFGLFRTLTYPIQAQKLLSALTLARAGLEIDVTELKTRHVGIEERQAREASATVEKAILPIRAPHPVAFTPGPAAVRPTVKRVSPAFTHPALSINVPMTIASMRRNRPSEPSRAPKPARLARPHSLTQTPPLGSPSELIRRATVVHPTQPQLARTAPKRTMVPLGAAIAVVFLVTTLTVSLFDASAAPSSSAQATRSSRVVSFSALRPEIAQPEVSVPPRNSTPAGPTPRIHPAQSVAQRAEPKADSMRPDEVAPDSQMAASSTPIADPSTFGSEAYEPIYSN
jgi:DNA-binding NarL/FixJ family response regulator